MPAHSAYPETGNVVGRLLLPRRNLHSVRAFRGIVPSTTGLGIGSVARGLRSIGDIHNSHDRMAIGSRHVASELAFCHGDDLRVSLGMASSGRQSWLMNDLL